MQTENTHLDQTETAAAVKTTVENLQSIGDQKRIDEVVYSWLKTHGVVIHEDAAEQLAGHLGGLVSRVRQGKDRPTDAEVRAQLEARNRNIAEHNAADTRHKLRFIDLDQLPAVLVQ